MSKRLLVFGDKTFRITIPDGATITFGPWSPPKSGVERGYGTDDAKRGTLRIYDGPKTTANIIAVFSGVHGFRDETMEYSEMVAREEGAALWKSDESGYSREEHGSVERIFVGDPASPKKLTNGTTRTRKVTAKE